jgi:hypothetical protein
VSNSTTEGQLGGQLGESGSNTEAALMKYLTDIEDTFNINRLSVLRITCWVCQTCCLKPSLH